MENFAEYSSGMKGTHKLLFPQMAPIHFKLLAEVLRQDGYDVEFLENDGAGVTREGLQYVHNDACYPALLVIGQFIDALKSGKYDLEKTALLISQTGGGCRASNYIFLLRKALARAGFAHVPVVSLNFSRLENGLTLSLKVLKKMLAAIFYGDLLMLLGNQVRPYEDTCGTADALIKGFQDAIAEELRLHKIRRGDVRAMCARIVADFARVPMTYQKRKRVGIVGEIYVKFSPLGNSNLERFLADEGCEVSVPGLLGFVQYCMFNMAHDITLYGGSRVKRFIIKKILAHTIKLEKIPHALIKSVPLTNIVSADGAKTSAVPTHFRTPCAFDHLLELSEGVIDLGCKMGEGWLLTTEMVELLQSGFNNIVCAQPFGCLPNHIVGKGMISKLRSQYPAANITPLDYDPSSTAVNQLNRLKLMLSNDQSTDF